MVLGSNLCLFGVNGGVVHGLLGFESLTFWGQWWCSAWSTWVRIFDFLGSMVV
jgi:hypothetical protein